MSGSIAHADHLIFITPLFSESTPFKKVSVHTTDQSWRFYCKFLQSEERSRKAPFSWRISVEGRPNRKKSCVFEFLRRSVDASQGRFPFDKNSGLISENSTDEWNSVFRNFIKRGQPCKVYRNFRQNSSRNFSSILNFLSKFPEFSVEGFTFRKFDKFQIFWKLSREISVLIVPSSKFSHAPKTTGTWNSCLLRLCFKTSPRAKLAIWEWVWFIRTWTHRLNNFS